MYVQSFNTIEENCRKSSQHKIVNILYTDTQMDAQMHTPTHGQAD